MGADSVTPRDDVQNSAATGLARRSIGLRLNVAILCILIFFLVSTSAAIVVLFEQYRAFRDLSGAYFDTAMSAAELARDAEVVASEIFESMLGVSRSAADDHRTDSNLLRIYEVLRNRLGAPDGMPVGAEGLAEADRWQQPYVESIQTLRARIFDERAINAERARAADEVTRLTQALDEKRAHSQGAGLDDVVRAQAVLGLTATALVSERLGQIDRLHTRAEHEITVLEQNHDLARDNVYVDILALSRQVFSSREAALKAQQATLATARQTRVLAQKLSGATYSYYLDLKQGARAANSRHQDIARTAIVTLASFVVVSLVAIVVFLVYIRRHIIGRLNRLGLAMTDHVRGRPTEVPQDGRDEIAAMGQAFQVFVNARQVAEQDLVAARNLAEQASRAKGEFLANMSHEIRTPLNAIIGFSALARQGGGSLEDTRSYLSKINSAAHHLLTVIDDILDFSRIEAGRLSLEHIAFDLSEVLDTMTDIVAAPARSKSLDLHVGIRPEVPRALIGDPSRLRQVLVNLAGNAVKFTQSGHVLVEVSQEDGDSDTARLRFTITDTGIGMSSAQMETLFGQFQQADPSISRRFGGSGLGLAISLRLVEMMGGTLTVESVEGEGSTFCFTLSFALQPAARQRLFAIPADMRTLRVLVCDAEPLSREMMQDRLAGFGLAHGGVATGGEAVAEMSRAITAGEPHYGLLVLDCAVSDPGYADTIGRIFDQVPSAQWPEIIAVVDGGTEDQDHPGVAAVLNRPVRTSDLFNAILASFGQSMAAEKYRSWVDGDLPADCAQLAGLRVLVVDDQPFNLEIAAKLLSDQGVLVDCLDNGAEAVARLRSLPSAYYAAVLMDVQMPNLDGYETTRRIREFHPAQALPIIAMTAHAMAEQRAACLAAGMNDHVAKPINVHRLWETVLNWTVRAGDLRGRTTAVPELNGFDMAAAAARLGGDTDYLIALVDKFPERVRPVLVQMRRALADSDWPALERHAHSVLGMAGAIGADALAQEAAILEEELRQGRTAQAASLVDRVETAHRRALTAIGAWRHT